MLNLAGATASIVDLIAPNNATFQDAIQFGLATDTWHLAPNWSMSIKMSRSDTTALVTFTAANGQIVVLDAINRIIQFNVPDTILQTDLPVGEYDYDLVMYDNSSPAIRTLLMQGKFFVTQGVTDL